MTNSIAYCSTSTKVLNIAIDQLVMTRRSVYRALRLHRGGLPYNSVTINNKKKPLNESSKAFAIDCQLLHALTYIGSISAVLSGSGTFSFSRTAAGNRAYCKLYITVLKLCNTLNLPLDFYLIDESANFRFPLVTNSHFLVHFQ